MKQEIYDLPVKYAVLELKELGGWLENYNNVTRGFIVSKCYLKKSSIEYFGYGMKEEKYDVIFPFTDFLEFKTSLKKYNYKLYKIYFELAQMIIQSGNWNLAAEYLRKILDDVDEDCQEYHYYKALAYQDLSNILSGQLFLDESIRYASDGIEDIREALLKYPQNSENLKMVEELLIERLAICQLFSGDINSAVITQEQAYQKALARNNSYTKLRIEYEKGDVLLHKNLTEGIKILEQKYQESLNCDMLFVEEPSLIHAMELVGKLLKAWHETDLSACVSERQGHGWKQSRLVLSINCGHEN